MKNRIPGIRLELLANEGCLFQCPFKPAHDAHIALSNTGLVREMTFETNRDAGCIALLSRYPEKLFKSPFIRPEDVHHYEGVADVLKLCGRTLGPGFLKTVITAYIQRRYPGNLSDILDAAQWMSHVFHIDNTLLGKDFFKTLTNCSKDCTVCTICSSLKDLTIDRKKPAFYRYEDGPWKF
jgi:collagenase-like PrtC family protease